MLLRHLLAPLCFIALFSSAETPPAVVANAPVPASALPATVATAPGFPIAEPGAVSIAIVPDTQFYAQLHPDIFRRQMQWTADHAAKYQIKFCIQLGDITETAADAEWEVAKASFERIRERIPFSTAPGNHDYGGKLQIMSRRSPFTSWFPLPLFQSMPTFGGVYDRQPEKCDNQFHKIEIADRKWLVLGLEFAPRDDVLRWAGDVAKAHRDHTVLLFTHAYIEPKQNALIAVTAGFGGKPRPGSPEAAMPPPDVNLGTGVWKKLASQHPNIAVVLCGHACYTSHRKDQAADGHTVHGIAVDYQKDVNGGNGWMRLWQFMPDGRTIRSRDFSTELGVTCTMPDRTYDFVIDQPRQP